MFYMHFLIFFQSINIVKLYIKNHKKRYVR